jgi:hypothetical protein
MKQVLFAACCCALLAVSIHAQNPGQTVLSKSVSGPITRSSVELTLTSNTECDQTQGFLPDGSKLISQSFGLNADSNGVGTFQGTAQIISPDGRTILQGQLRGTVGINTGCGGNRTCRLPWHLEGLFETTPSTYERLIARSTTDLKVTLMMLNFSADLNQQSTSPLPLYQGRLDGLIPTLPASAAKVTIAPDKASYTINDPITAIVVNGAEDVIQTYDLKSYCSIVQLQIQNGNQWDNVGDCTLKRLPFPVNLQPNQQTNVLLSVMQGIPAPAAGTYRLALTFRFLENGIPVSDSFTAFSPPFVIASLPPSNNVSVKAERDVYPEREPVVVKITNDSEQPIVTMDHKSYCSILTVQKQQANDWITVAQCLLATPTRLVKIGAREELLLKLPADGIAARIEPGTYRMELIYFAMDANGQPTGNPSTVYSRTFTVAAKE